MMVTAFVEGVGVWGPGLEGWARAACVLTGDSAYDGAATALPPLELLPPAERRRVGLSIKLSLSVAHAAVTQAQLNAGDLATVFASSGGDGETIHNILTSLATPQRLVSPTRFHNSVHNAPSGYWALAVQSRAPSTTVSAHDWSFSAGMIEAMTQAVTDRRAVMLIAYDHAYPEPLHAVRPLTAAFGVALALSPVPSARTLSRLDLSLEGEMSRETVMSDPALEKLRLGNPAARALPLLEVLARQREDQVTFEGAGSQRVVITCTPATP